MKENQNWNLCLFDEPSENEEVLLTFKNEAGIHVQLATYKKGGYFYIAEIDNKYYEELFNNPIAFMKLPKPYNLKYVIRSCKDCNCNIAPKYSGYNNYDEDGLCSLCGDNALEEGTIEEFEKEPERLTICTEEEYDKYMCSFTL